MEMLNFSYKLRIYLDVLLMMYDAFFPLKQLN